MPAYLTESSTTIREDLADRIAIISPNDTPLFHLLEKESCHNTLFDWSMDNIDAEETTQTSGDFARVEGVDATYPTLTARQRASNYTHIVTRPAQVSDTERKVLEAGVDDEFSYQIYKKFLTTLKQADYVAHFSEFQALAGGSDPSRTHGLANWLYACGLTTASAATIAAHTITTSTYRSTYLDNAGVNLTRDVMHDSLLQPAHVGGMDLSGAVALVPSQMKRLISQFAFVYSGGSTTDTGLQLNERNIGARERTLIDTVDVFETDFGTVYMNIDRRMNSGTTVALGGSVTESLVTSNSEEPDEMVIIIDPTMFRLRILRGLTFVPLAKTGDSTKGMAVIEFGFQPDNPKGGILAVDAHTA